MNSIRRIKRTETQPTDSNHSDTQPLERKQAREWLNEMGFVLDGDLVSSSGDNEADSHVSPEWKKSAA